MHPFYNALAMTEGWFLNDRYLDGARNPRIKHTDWCASRVFRNDEEAEAFVRQRAAEGSVYHLDALARMAFGEFADLNLRGTETGRYPES